MQVVVARIEIMLVKVRFVGMETDDLLRETSSVENHQAVENCGKHGPALFR